MLCVEMYESGHMFVMVQRYFRLKLASLTEGDIMKSMLRSAKAQRRTSKQQKSPEMNGLTLKPF